MTDELAEGLDGDQLLPSATQYKKGAMLVAYAAMGNLTHACKEAGITRRTHRLWLKDDPDYALKFLDAQDEAVDVLEAELHKRAVGGYSAEDMKGKVRGSDLLLIFLLKGLRPAKYRDNAKPDAETQAAAGTGLGWEQQQELADLADMVLAERAGAANSS